ncbi:hypothetical protein MKZ38_002288 [Zalerion maritima]|uniref:Uncharacterized protein n=1 Tax=Zalerion maritima TaxID=339359 RepID=A0AAD5RP55_9PEZI|nr:hypothetical protein MKZ38_002288 [Zalerion maritima]
MAIRSPGALTMAAALLVLLPQKAIGQEDSVSCFYASQLRVNKTTYDAFREEASHCSYFEGDIWFDHVPEINLGGIETLEGYIIPQYWSTEAPELPEGVFNIFGDTVKTIQGISCYAFSEPTKVNISLPNVTYVETITMQSHVASFDLDFADDVEITVDHAVIQYNRELPTIDLAPAAHMDWILIKFNTMTEGNDTKPEDAGAIRSNSLQSVDEYIYVGANEDLREISFPVLETAGDIRVRRNHPAAPPTYDFPSLKSTRAMSFWEINATVSMPELEEIVAARKYWSTYDRFTFWAGAFFVNLAELEMPKLKVVRNPDDSEPTDDQAELSFWKMMDGFTVLDLPLLASVQGVLTIDSNRGLKDVNIDKLEQVGGLVVTGNAIGLFVVPELTTVDGDVHIEGNYLRRVTAPKLTTVGGDLIIKGSGNLSEIEIPSLETVTGSIILRAQAGDRFSCTDFKKRRDDIWDMASSFECSETNEDGEDGEDGEDNSAVVLGIRDIRSRIRGVWVVACSICWLIL